LLSLDERLCFHQEALSFDGAAEILELLLLLTVD
jgi:hypothetical protein